MNIILSENMHSYFQRFFYADLKRLEKDLCLSLHTKTNSKWIKGQKVTPKTIKLLEENMEKYFERLR
jgi:hypothetical protein